MSFGDGCYLSQPYYMRITTQTKQKRLKQHYYAGAIKHHLKQEHNTETT